MLRVTLVWFSLVLLWAASPLSGQTPESVRGADQRFKTDILVVVAHPDDEGGVTPYLARAIYDLHKRVAVVYLTRGGSGGNEFSAEHGPALANIREIEARQACAHLGITNVWFLDGKDTASQNVLRSLANWGHGENLEKLVGIFRLTQPEVVLTWLPGVFIGENHGDHQASGVLATEAFDLAGDPTSFPAQVAGASKRLEPYLENLTPWQAKKIYYFSDARDDKQFAGTGPSYSIKEISTSEKKPYWRLALDAATPHKTQFPKEIEQLSKLNDQQLEKMMNDPNTGWWSDPLTLIFGKSISPGSITDDVFALVQRNVAAEMDRKKTEGQPVAGEAHRPHIELAGIWRYYNLFRVAHGMPHLPVAPIPEIAIKSGSTLSIPLEVFRIDTETNVVTIKLDVPKGWKPLQEEFQITLPKGARSAFTIELETPTLSADELKRATPQLVSVHASESGRSWGDLEIKVALQAGGLPQN